MTSLDCLKIIARTPDMHPDLPSYLVGALFFARLIRVNPDLHVLELTTKGKKALIGGSLRS